MQALLLGALVGILAVGGAQASTAGCTASPAGRPFDWSGKRVLWLGTSIPHQGIRSGTSYPELFCQSLGCEVVNAAFPASHVRWHAQGVDESCTRAGLPAPRGLSATRRELAAKVAAMLPDDGSSSYHRSCQRAVRIEAQGYEDRINAPWARGRPFDAVVIDHGHNDRQGLASGARDALGELEASPLPIRSIEAGRTTRVRLAAPHNLRVHDDVTIRTPGLPRMDHWTGEVIGASEDSVELPLDSRGIAGTYVAGGSLVRHDKSRFFDAFNLVISDVLHMNAFHGGPPVLVVLATPPTEWSHGVNNGSIAAVNRSLRQLAAKWQFPLYDMTTRLGIGPANLRSFLPDSVHPTTPAARETIARDAVQWARTTRLVFDSCSNRWEASPGAASR